MMKIILPFHSGVPVICIVNPYFINISWKEWKNHIQPFHRIILLYILRFLPDIILSGQGHFLEGVGFSKDNIEFSF